MASRTIIIGSIGLVLVLLFLSGCTQSQAPPSQNTVCTQEYLPVCGSDAKTYSNDCMAEAAGVDVAYTGECRPPTTATHGCTKEYVPVCGVNGDTYGNACMAREAGVDVDYLGECRTQTACTLEYAPVCGANGDTYGNACMAEAAGVDVAYTGECSEGYSDVDPAEGKSETFCPPIVGQAVCGDDGKTYANACLATVANAVILHSGPC